MAAGRSPRLLSILFVAVLGAYSAVWMYYIHGQTASNARGFTYEYRPSNGEVILNDVRPNGAAARAGLTTGDRIMAIDGRRLVTFRTFLDAFGRTPVGRTLRLDVRGHSGSRVVPLTLVTWRQELGDAVGGETLTARLLTMALTGYPLIFLGVGAGVLLQRPWDRDAWAMALAFGGLIAGAPLLLLEPQMVPGLRRFMVPLWTFLVSLMPAALFYFFAVFPAPSAIDRRVPWLKHVIGGAAVLCGGVLAVLCLLAGDSGALWWVRERLPPPVIEWTVLLYSLGCLVLAFVSLVSNAFSDIETRRKTSVILAGTVLGFGPILLLQSMVALSGRPPQDVVPFWVRAAASLAIVLVPLSVAYTVVKHRVMELPVLFRRSARYVLVRRGAVTMAVLLGIGMTLGFAGVLARFFTMSSEGAERLALVAGSAFGGLLALTGERLWRPAEERIDRAFFRGAYDARRILEQLARDCRLATDRDTLARNIESSLEEALHPQALYVYVRAGQGGQLLAAGADAEALAGTPLTLDAPGLLELAKRGYPQVLEPADLLPGGPFAACASLRPELLVPMLGRAGELEGLLVLATRLSEEPYSSEDRALLGSAGEQAGLALESIRLAEAMAAQIDAERRRVRELEIAKAVQAKLLPQDTPVLGTLEYLGRCIQARQIGGDYFDFIAVGESRLALVLADISGKGISAALLMASLQAGLRAQYTSAPGDLRDVLRTVNRVFLHSTATNHYATLFFAVYDEATRALRYANCGHLPPMLRRANGSVIRLGGTAPVIGMFDEWECTTAETTLDPDDVLVVFSDGATEAPNEAGEEFGEERLAALIDAHGRDGARPLLDTIISAVLAHSGRDQFDDLTLIVAKGR